MNNLKDIHNSPMVVKKILSVVLSGFQWTIWRTYTTHGAYIKKNRGCFIRISMNNLKDIHNFADFFDKIVKLFYQDFNEQFEGHTQPHRWRTLSAICCFIRISMNNLKDIHNYTPPTFAQLWLFYQDFNEQFEGHTQRRDSSLSDRLGCFIRISMNNLKDIHNINGLADLTGSVVLSGFQWTIWRTYTTIALRLRNNRRLFYQDFNEQFEGHTQHCCNCIDSIFCCFIRISMNNLKDIHNFGQYL